MSEKKIVGFDKKIRYAWMEAAAYWSSEGLSPKDIRINIDSLLKDQLSDTGKRSSMSKVKSILMRIWGTQNDELGELRKISQKLYSTANENEKLLLHWGLASATYPFFFHVAEHTGRLLSITNEIRSRQVVRRIKETYGERSTIDYAAPRVFRSFVEWGTLETMGKQLILKSTEPKRIEKNPQLISWLMEIVIRAKGKQMLPFKAIVSSPALFPFSIESQISYVKQNKRLIVYRQNVDEDLVLLKS